MFFLTCVTKIGCPSMDTPANFCVYVLKFRVREHGMPCALEKKRVITDLRKDMWNLAPQLLEKSYLHYHNSYSTKLGGNQTWMVTHHQGLPPIESIDPFITWSCYITWRTKTIMAQLPQWLWPPNLAGWWLALMGSYPWNHMTISSTN